MKTLKINLQTLLFFTENEGCQTILAVYNENKKLLVYNKPICSNKDIVEIVCQLEEEMGKVVDFTYQTDLFGINFYDFNTGGTSEFHEVEGKGMLLTNFM